ncbi:MAG: UDP-glucuronate 5-epimerase, partial [Pseudomonadota bacterium]
PLMDFIAAIEDSLGAPLQKNFMEMQKGDVHATHADNSLLRRLTGYAPRTTVQDGVAQFVAWYRDYYDK